jgi:hypothetical protein
MGHTQHAAIGRLPRYLTGGYLMTTTIAAPEATSRLTSDERVALARAFTIIKGENTNYICIALSYVGSDCPSLEGVCLSLKKSVQSAISPYDSLGGWQHHHGIHRSFEQLKQDRLNWIQYMLENW